MTPAQLQHRMQNQFQFPCRIRLNNQSYMRHFWIRSTNLRYHTR